MYSKYFSLPYPFHPILYSPLINTSLFPHSSCVALSKDKQKYACFLIFSSFIHIKKHTNIVFGTQLFFSFKYILKITPFQRSPHNFFLQLHNGIVCVYIIVYRMNLYVWILQFPIFCNYNKCFNEQPYVYIYLYCWRFIFRVNSQKWDCRIKKQMHILPNPPL